MNESTWKYRIDALKATEKHLLERERKCRIRELAMERAIEEGVNSRQERQMLELIDRCIIEHDAGEARRHQEQYYSYDDNNNNFNNNNNNNKNNRSSSSSSCVLALNEIASVAAELDTMRRNVLVEAEDINLERHRLRIWAEQLHAAFASLNARSVELQLEAQRLSGLPQASIELSSSLASSILGLNSTCTNNNKNNTSSNQRSSVSPAPSSMLPSRDISQRNLKNLVVVANNNNNSNDAIPFPQSSSSASGGSLPLHEVLLRREAALNERERHVTELFRYVLDQRVLVEKQLELIGERIESLQQQQYVSAAASASPTTGRTTQQHQQPRSNSNSHQQHHFNHPLLATARPSIAGGGIGNVIDESEGNGNNDNNTGDNNSTFLLHDLDSAERFADSRAGRGGAE